jgi:hypothetical protein
MREPQTSHPVARTVWFYLQNFNTNFKFGTDFNLWCKNALLPNKAHQGYSSHVLEAMVVLDFFGEFYDDVLCQQPPCPSPSVGQEIGRNYAGIPWCE